MCAQYGNYDSLAFLLSKKPLDPIYILNSHQDTLLHVASKHENLEIVKLIVTKIYESFSSIDSYLTLKNKHGKTFFHIACANGIHNIVHYALKELRVHSTHFVNLPDLEHNTGLHLAAKNGHLQIVNLLIENGADINLKNKDSNNALEVSCRSGYFEVTKALINRYSNLGLDSGRDNPLHFACREGAYEVVELLLAKGVAIDSLDEQNKNCLDVAIEKG